MKIAYLILAHTDWDHLARLVRAIKSDWADVFVHVDAKSDFNLEHFSHQTADAVPYIIKPRMQVYWGDLSIVNATIATLRAARSVGSNYERLILLSGQDYPLRHNQHIHDFFLSHPTNEFLEFAKLPVRWWPYGGMDRIQVYNFPKWLGRRGNQIARAIQMGIGVRRNSSRKMIFYGSSQWFCITGEALNVILDVVDNSSILKQFSYSYCADELFFQTILLNSHLAKNCENANLRYMDWPRGDSGPKVLGLHDFDKLPLDKSNVMFARKFRTGKSCELLDKIDAVRRE